MSSLVMERARMNLRVPATKAALLYRMRVGLLCNKSIYILHAPSPSIISFPYLSFHLPADPFPTYDHANPVIVLRYDADLD